MHAIVVAHEVRELLAEPPPQTPGVTVLDVTAVPAAAVGWRVAGDGGLVAPDAVATWWIDADGHKHAAAGEDHQILTCAWADRVVGDGGAWRVEAPAEAAARLAAGVIAHGHAAIDALCDAAYTVSPSRGARYQRKEEEARAFVASGSPEAPEPDAYPILVAEAAARGLSLADMAAEVIVAADAYHALAAHAEAARARLAIAVNAAALAGDLAAMQAAADTEIEIVRAALS